MDTSTGSVWVITGWMVGKWLFVRSVRHEDELGNIRERQMAAHCPRAPKTALEPRGRRVQWVRGNFKKKGKDQTQISKSR